MTEGAPAQSEVRLTTLDIGGGVVRFPESKLEIVRRRLDEGSISYWVSGTVITMPGEEPSFRISISRNADMDQVRAVLDDLL